MPANDEFWTAVETDEKRRKAAKQADYEARVAELFKHFSGLDRDLRELREKSDQKPAAPPVQKVLITEAFATGLAFGVGFWLAPGAIAIIAGLIILIASLGV